MEIDFKDFNGSLLADAARSAAERAGESIDDALAFVEASNKRIAAVEVKTFLDMAGNQ